MSQKFLTPINLNKNELQNAVIQNLAVAPGAPTPGLFYFDTTLNCLRVYSGTVWVNLVPAQAAFTPKGSWNAATNTPALASGVGTVGDLYHVSVAGSTTLDGFSAWDAGDALFFDGTVWTAIDNTQYVTATQLATKTGKYSQDVGDASATAIVITHNLNTRDVHVSLRDNSSPYANLFPDIEMTSLNTVTLRFTTAPTANQYRVVVVG